MKCKKCGIEFDGKFCPNCGEPLEKPKKKKKVLSKVIIALVILAGIGIAAGSDEDDNTSETVTATDMTQDESDIESTITSMSKAELYQILGQPSEGNSGYNMTQKSIDFINEHEDLLPASDLGSIEQYVDNEIGYRNISKSPDNYGDQIIVVDYAGVVYISEEKVGDSTFTTLQAYDEDGQSYMVYYFGALPDVLDDDYVKIYGVPLGTTSFDNISGGTTLAVVFGGCYVEKIQE